MDEMCILINIQYHLDNLLKNLNNTNVDVELIKNNVKNLNNTYFTNDKQQIISQFLTIFDKGLVDEFKDYVSQYKNIIDNKINNSCAHEWVTDLIDITPDKSQYICYCRFCEVTKKI